MSGLRRLASVCLWLFAAAGCAAQSFPMHAPTVISAPNAPAALDAPAPLVLPPPVEGNQTFITVDGMPRYRIGSGDVLDVVLTRELAQDRMSAVVRPNGKVSVGFFEAAVDGLTTDQAEQEIRRVLAPTYRQLTVEVTIKEYGSKTVSVLGEVPKLGVFPLKGRTNLVDLLAQAGGLSSNADARTIRLLRRGGDSYTLDLVRLVSEGQRFRELVLDAGDVVFVPSRTPDEQRRIYVIGEVKSPGMYPYTPNIRLSQVLAMAGGPTPNAVLESVRVVRGDLHSPQIVEVFATSFTDAPDRSQDIVLQTNDLVVIPRSKIGDWNAFLGQLRPTLEFLTIPLQGATSYFVIRDLIK